MTCRGAVFGLLEPPRSTISVLSRVKNHSSRIDSTITPPPTPKPAILFNEKVSWLLDTREDAMKKTLSHIFLFAKDDRNMMSRWQGAPYARRYGRGLV